MEIRDESDLGKVLAQLDRSEIDRPSEMVNGVLADYDFEFGETLRARLEARPAGRAAQRKIHARMPLGARHVYQLVTKEGELGIFFERGFGGNSPSTHAASTASPRKGGLRGGSTIFPTSAS